MLPTALVAVAVLSQPSDRPNAADLRAILLVFHSEFIPMTPGEGPFPAVFRMGGNQSDEQPARDVTMDRPFRMAKYEVPQDLWQAVMGSNPSRWKGARNSVEQVSHDEALAFCRKATELMRREKILQADQVIRLPSEAEWEYCARAGTTTAYSFGDDPSKLGDYGWFTGNASGNDPPVGAKRPNAWGFHDMHGYLWEWCLDAAHDTYDGAPANGDAWMEHGDPARRVIRGGSWKDPAESLRSSTRSGRFPHRAETGEPVPIAFRGGVDRDLRDDAVGLRCVLDTERRPNAH
ncbi:MAG: formylglycine-generating enzyme family protein [Planctomycetes bacterium]|nr:formylglycine-generating enzyme family protein [Planctomycetota bacterium]